MSRKISYHDQVVRQAAWVATHDEMLRRALPRVSVGRDRVRLDHVIRSLEMGHIVVEAELEWALGLAIWVLGSDR